MASRINIYRRKIALGEYELTDHAKREMEQDRLTIADIKATVYSGKVLWTQRHGGRNRKDVVEGKSTQSRVVRLICRMTPMRRLRIITVFALKKP